MSVSEIVGISFAGLVVGWIGYAFLRGGSLIQRRQEQLAQFARSLGLSYEAGPSPLTFRSGGQIEGRETVVEYEMRLRNRLQQRIARFSVKPNKALPNLVVALGRSEEAAHVAAGLGEFQTGDPAFDAKYRTRAGNAADVGILSQELRELLMQLAHSLRSQVTLTIGPSVELRLDIGTEEQFFDPERLSTIVKTLASVDQ